MKQSNSLRPLALRTAVAVPKVEWQYREPVPVAEMSDLAGTSGHCWRERGEPGVGSPSTATPQAPLQRFIRPFRDCPRSKERWIREGHTNSSEIATASVERVQKPSRFRGYGSTTHDSIHNRELERRHGQRIVRHACVFQIRAAISRDLVTVSTALCKLALNCVRTPSAACEVLPIG
jgi:hypothetical protein